MAKYADITTYEKASTDPVNIPSDITDFIGVFDASNFSTAWWNASSGDGVRVFKGDTDTEIARELVDFTDNGDGTGSGQIWFKGDGTTASGVATDYYVGRRPGESDYAVDATYGAQNVWKGVEGTANEFSIVSHDGGLTDSTYNSHNGTENGGVVGGGITGKVGAATEYHGGGEYIDISAHSANLDAVLASGSYTWLSWVEHVAPNYVDGMFEVDGGKYGIYVGKNNNGLSLSINLSWKRQYGSFVAADGWQHITVTEAPVVTINSVSTTNTGGTGSYGNYTGTYRYGKGQYGDYVGKLNQCWLLSGHLTSDFTETLYNNQNDIAGFWVLADYSEDTNSFILTNFKSEIFGRNSKRINENFLSTIIKYL